MSERGEGLGGRAFVLTVSDGVNAGVRQDGSGDALVARLAELGFGVERGVVPDEPSAIVAAVEGAAQRCVLVVTTGGTGLTPRDVTPQTLRSILDYDVPGFGELMRSAGARSTPRAYLSRSLAGVRGRCLVVALPGSSRGAVESLAAIEGILGHALETVRGPFDHSTLAAAPGGEPASSSS